MAKRPSDRRSPGRNPGPQVHEIFGFGKKAPGAPSNQYPHEDGRLTGEETSNPPPPSGRGRQVGYPESCRAPARTTDQAPPEGRLTAVASEAAPHRRKDGAREPREGPAATETPEGVGWGACGKDETAIAPEADIPPADPPWPNDGQQSPRRPTYRRNCAPPPRPGRNSAHRAAIENPPSPTSIPRASPTPSAGEGDKINQVDCGRRGLDAGTPAPGCVCGLLHAPGTGPGAGRSAAGFLEQGLVQPGPVLQGLGGAVALVMLKREGERNNVFAGEPSPRGGQPCRGLSTGWRPPLEDNWDRRGVSVSLQIVRSRRYARGAETPPR
nr:uncharacterized protein LOC109977573 [Labrus bergylta]